jgi:hypothetical protein
MTATIPVRKMNADGRISVRLLNVDGTEPAAGTPELSTKDHPETFLTDQRYNLDGSNLNDKVDGINQSLLWLSDRNPLLFEEFLSYLEKGIPKAHTYSVIKLLDLAVPPIETVSGAYVHSFYRNLIDTSSILFSLADDGWHGVGLPDRRAWSLFFATENSCGHTTQHKYFKETVLAVWIMQEAHDLSNPFQADDNLAELEFIASRFDEVYDARDGLRERCTIDSGTITEYLKHHGPMRIGAL